MMKEKQWNMSNDSKNFTSSPQRQFSSPEGGVRLMHKIEKIPLFDDRFTK